MNGERSLLVVCQGHFSELQLLHVIPRASTIPRFQRPELVQHIWSPPYICICSTKHIFNFVYSFVHLFIHSPLTLLLQRIRFIPFHSFSSLCLFVPKYLMQYIQHLSIESTCSKVQNTRKHTKRENFHLLYKCKLELDAT